MAKTPGELPKVHLQPAHSFICPVCDTMQFIEATIVEFSVEDKKRLAKKYPGQTFTTGDWLSSPSVATCADCSCDFDVCGSWLDGPGGDSEDDEDED